MSNADVTIEIKSLGFRRIGAQMMAAIDDEVNTSAMNVLSSAQLAIMNPPKTGVTYKSGQRVHQASAPGEAPANDLGNLAGSGTTRRVALGHYQVVFSTPYAKPLEYGNAAGTILPRPYVRPALHREGGILADNIRRAMGKAR